MVLLYLKKNVFFIKENKWHLFCRITCIMQKAYSSLLDCFAWKSYTASAPHLDLHEGRPPSDLHLITSIPGIS